MSISISNRLKFIELFLKFSDFVISLKTLRSFYLVIAPLLEIPINQEPKNISTKTLTTLNNQVLPLAYLECQDIRVIIPSADLIGSGAAHDVFFFQVKNIRNGNGQKYLCKAILVIGFLFQVHKIALSPSAVNPICRSPLRTDIYEQAAHARILSIPGK